MTLRKKMAHGVFWTFLEKFGQQFILIATFAVLTHLIGPEEFGLYSLCYVIISLSVMVLYGVIDSVILNRSDDDESLSTLFWTILGIGTLLSVATYACSGLFAWAMNDTRLYNLMRALSIIPALLSVTAVPSGIVQARMDFRVFTIRTLVASSLSGVVGVVMAMRGAGAYSLIGQQIVQQIIENIIIWPSIGWTPRFSFHPQRAWPLIKPGLKMMSSSLMNFFELNTARLLIGIVLGPVSVGYYSFVSRLWIVLREVLALPVTTVLFPALVQTRDDPAETLKLMRQIAFISSLIVFPAIAGVIATSPLFIPIFFGAKWTPSVPIMQILLLSSVTAPFLMSLRDILRAQHKMERFFVFQLGAFLLNFVVMLMTVRSGLIPLCWGLVVVAAINFPLGVFYVSRQSHQPLWTVFGPTWGAALASAGMYGVLTLLRDADFMPPAPIVQLFSMILVGGASYVGFVLLFQYRTIRNGLQSLKALMAARRAKPSPLPVEGHDL